MKINIRKVYNVTLNTAFAVAVALIYYDNVLNDHTNITDNNLPSANSMGLGTLLVANVINCGVSIYDNCFVTSQNEPVLLGSIELYGNNV